jgi:transglutaminase-like putative cysteine protease
MQPCDRFDRDIPRHRILRVILLLAVSLRMTPLQAEEPAVPRQRTFEFTYAGRVLEVTPGKTARVWLPVASSNAAQDVTLLKTAFPAEHVANRDREYGNRLFFFEAKRDERGTVPFEMRFAVTRREIRTDAHGKLSVRLGKEATPVERFLQPDTRVPVGGKPLELIKDRRLPADPMQAGKVLYDVVNGHMTYSKQGVGWGHGDSVWACDSKFGNCTDFHSLFISMARGSKIPAKFEMGFSIPDKPGEGTIGGYHCWAWFLAGDHGWIPVDISEANRFPEKRAYYFGNLSENRVQFTTGRDIQLEPRQSGPALNFFVYPYVEVDGQPHPSEKIERSFAYRDR